MVFLFFGLMATCGTAYVMVETVPVGRVVERRGMGLLAVAILVANNLRDIPTDARGRQADARGAAGRGALADAVPRVRGRRRSSRSASACSSSWRTSRAGLTQWALFGLLAWVPAIKPMEVVGKATGRDLIPVLTGTAATHAACGLLMTVGLILWHAQHVVPVHVVKGWAMSLGDVSLACADRAGRHAGAGRRRATRRSRPGRAPRRWRSRCRGIRTSRCTSIWTSDRARSSRWVWRRRCTVPSWSRARAARPRPSCSRRSWRPRSRACP